MSPHVGKTDTYPLLPAPSKPPPALPRSSSCSPAKTRPQGWPAAPHAAPPCRMLRLALRRMSVVQQPPQSLRQGMGMSGIAPRRAYKCSWDRRCQGWQVLACPRSTPRPAAAAPALHPATTARTLRAPCTCLQRRAQQHQRQRWLGLQQAGCQQPRSQHLGPRSLVCCGACPLTRRTWRLRSVPPSAHRTRQACTARRCPR